MLELLSTLLKILRIKNQRFGLLLTVGLEEKNRRWSHVCFPLFSFLFDFDSFLFFFLFSFRCYLFGKRGVRMAASERGRICSQTFVIEGIPDEQVGYNGAPLLRVKAGEKVDQFYMNREAQKAHWPLFRAGYKKSQSKAKDGRPYLEAYEEKLTSLSICFDELKAKLLSSPSESAELPCLIRRLRVLMDERGEEAEEKAIDFHTLMRGLIFHPQNIMERAMANPGMVSLMLGDLEEDLLGEQTRVMKRLSKYNGIPTDEYIRDFITDPAEKKRVKALCKKAERLELDGMGKPPSMSFCFIYFNMLVATVVHAQPSPVSGNDGKGTIRGSDGPETSHEYRLATAALRRALSLFSDPLVLTATGSAMNPAASLLLTALKHYDQRKNLGGRYCQPYEILPGLPLEKCVGVCLQELEECSLTSRYSVEILQFLAKRPELWNNLKMPIERRAQAALAILAYIHEHGDEDDEDDGFMMGMMGGGGVTPPVKECNIILKAACGLLPKKDLETTKEVFKLAVDEGEFLGPRESGNNTDFRALFLFLSRQGRYEINDFAEEMEDYDLMDEDEKTPESKLKKECSIVVLGERLHKELGEMRAKWKNVKMP